MEQKFRLVKFQPLDAQNQVMLSVEISEKRYQVICGRWDKGSCWGRYCFIPTINKGCELCCVPVGTEENTERLRALDLSEEAADDIAEAIAIVVSGWEYGEACDGLIPEEEDTRVALTAEELEEIAAEIGAGPSFGSAQ